MSSDVHIESYDKKSETYQMFSKCGHEGCQDKVIIQLDLSTGKNAPFKYRTPLCRKHLEEMYKAGFFSDLINKPEHMQMIEGIIKFGSIEEWLKNKK